MATVKTFAADGKATGTAELNPTVFDGTVHEGAVHAVVTGQLRNQRQGTANTKERSDTAFSHRKPWRQKGTGRARAGGRNSPLWRGGGTVFGPHPREWNRPIPKKLRRLALKSVLQDRADHDALYVVDGIPLTEPKTKAAAAWLATLGVSGRTLVVTATPDPNCALSLRNLPYVSHTFVGQVSAKDLAAHRTVVVTKEALGQIEQTLA